MKANRRSPVRALRTLLLPRDERAAARAERRAEDALRAERDNVETPERRAAALEAEKRRATMHGGGGVGGM
jgi:hypothetical protein